MASAAASSGVASSLGTTSSGLAGVLGSAAGSEAATSSITGVGTAVGFVDGAAVGLSLTTFCSAGVPEGDADFAGAAASSEPPLRAAPNPATTSSAAGMITRFLANHGRAGFGALWPPTRPCCCHWAPCAACAGATWFVHWRPSQYRWDPSGWGYQPAGCC